jgi:enterobacterial common antigen flippase
VTTADSSPEPDQGQSSTYGQILRSSAIVGGASALNLAVSILRTKAMALMLGPAGFGLMAAFTTIIDLVRCVAEMGVNNSGVRQIAESAGSDDSEQIARAVTVLRSVTLALGLFGALLLAVLSRPVAVLTFGDADYGVSVALLSLAVFFRIVAEGQGALLQGLRRIGELARLGVIGSLIGSAVSIGLVYWLREDGVAISLVAIAATSCLLSWWYSRKVRVATTHLTSSRWLEETGSLLRMGLAFMMSSLLTMGAAYVVRLLIIRDEGLHAAGLYQAAWAVGGIYVAFILQAMGTDFYPRLVAVANRDPECNRLVNEQTHVSLLLAGAGVVATLSFAPWALAVLYSAEFVASAETLRWVCLGMALRVVTWPLGYILVAKGKAVLFIGTDLIWAVTNVALTWLAMRTFGLVGAGVAFFGSYFVHLLLVYPIARKLSGFRWSKVVWRTGLAFAMLIAAVHAGFLLLDLRAALGIGASAFVLAAAFSALRLRRIAGDQIPSRRIGKLLALGRQPRHQA